MIPLLNCSFALLLSCGSIDQTNSAQKEYNKTLVGEWTGTLTSESVLKKTWQITRTADGNFSKDELLGIGGRKQRIRRTGTWWTKNGIYFEKNNSDKTAGKFEYQLLKDKKVNFKSEKSGESILEYTESKQ